MLNFKTFKHILLGGTIALLLASCRDDQTTFTPYDNGQAELTKLLQTVPAPKETFTFSGADLTGDRSIVLSNGVRILLQDNDHLFTSPDGAPIAVTTSSKVEIEIESSLTVGDWIGRNLPFSNDTGAILDHIGAVKITVRCDGQLVQIQPNRNLKIYIPSAKNNTGYEAAYTYNDQGFWDMGTPNSVFSATWNGTTQGVVHEGFELLAKKMEWTTAIQPLSPNDLIGFSVTMPLQFDGQNTRVFLVFDDGHLAIEMKPVGNGGEFVAAAVPNNTNVRVVSLSATGGQYWLGDVVTHVANDQTTVHINPEPSSTQYLTDFLKSL